MNHPSRLITIFALSLMLMTAYMEVTKAQTIVEYCERQFDFNTIGPQTPYTQKKCSLIFEKKTYEWMTGKYTNPSLWK